MLYDIYAVSDTLKKIRKQLGYTQSDMAESLDISYAHYSQIEQGRHRMSLDHMLKIVSKYDVDPNTLLGIIRKDDENKMVDILNEKLKMLSHAEREYVIFTFLIFMKGFDVYELHIK